MSNRYDCIRFFGGVESNSSSLLVSNVFGADGLSASVVAGFGSSVLVSLFFSSLTKGRLTDERPSDVDIQVGNLRDLASESS